MASDIIGSDLGLSGGQRETLDLVLDMIVPPSGDGRLPGASEVGVPAFLASHAADYVPRLAEELDRLDADSRAAAGRRFAEAGREVRQRVLDAARASVPGFLGALALHAVTRYYQDDRVMVAIGLEPRPPFPKGYEVPSGDLGLLEPVRRRGRVWREA